MSSGSDSDEEYVPGEPEQVSEEGSADEETDLQYEKEQEIKTKKRKVAQESKSKKKRRTRNADKEPTPEPEEKEPEENLDPVEEKKREEDLWAKFLAGTGSVSKAPAKETPVKQAEKSETTKKVSDEAKPVKPQAKTSSIQDEVKAREQRIFQFAGETIVVENNIIKEKIKTAEASATVSKLIPQVSRGSGGLADVLGQLNKKNRLSTLEKSKLDWETYKKDQDINDEVQSHNKGKNGYLDRQDFLERADRRQYELERDARLSRRTNR